MFAALPAIGDALIAAAPSIAAATAKAAAVQGGTQIGKAAGSAIVDAFSDQNNSPAQQRMIAMASQGNQAANYPPGAPSSRTLLGNVGDTVQNIATAPFKLAANVTGGTLSGIGNAISGVGDFISGKNDDDLKNQAFGAAAGNAMANQSRFMAMANQGNQSFNF